MQNKKLDSKNYYYIYGKHPVFSALNNPKRQIEDILCTQMIFDANKKLISSKPYKIVNNDVLSKLLENQTHQGIAAKVKPIFSHNIEDINIKNSKCKIAILDQITDPQNIGAIIRSAAAFNMDAIILPLDNSPNENGTIAKAACGTLELIKIIKVTNLNSCINYLKKHGFWVIGLTGEADDYFTDKLISDKIALVFGSEDKGMRRLVQENCDHLAKIPISDKVESLNVSNAASIIFHSLWDH
ncbi:23S rRNA (guanosine(2251)-2'-O)-methyltransferase RlmB [Rickettsia sp. MEAM1 (Bemisia tabaci)]|uniref:23S rRNA (guanosine(2251)-2'-O)-methyltransferase RlmB n=1 Tax=unclassified Rickettsia TaxID=114295 RepID=UPI0002F6D6B1|nr:MULTISPECIES: 23S rRNA (guanosine(2251)-2'-O)-methyltransferase RlmB [unclassified Rickettsia]ASX28232.1 23S rRNA (guanosine(2251)-2'-O)-methyltransferase RlmB [Rickettsia sp. MEAM1 (Bemisia tabaci)]ODA37395.1 23S rRNA (guanosine(2251)-2'-O)-methyltransferase RlmB [Rickettsia sp. wq]ODA37579.1 23S rRNA (guanosine(2251)-2'-O)-methyltransferase RlmB [Rickettsia sp. wb]